MTPDAPSEAASPPGQGKLQAEEALRNSEAKLRSYLDHAPFAILVINASGCVVDCNPQCAQVLGYQPHELQELNVANLHPHQLQEAIRSSLEEVIPGKPISKKITICNREARQLTVEFSAAAVDDGCSIAFLRDCTEEHASGDRIQQLEAQFRQAQKMEAIGRLAGGIAHDFNNLLMVIMAEVELLRPSLSGVALQRGDSISAASQRAAELTNQLLAFSRKQTIQPRLTTMGEVASGISQMLRRILGEDVEVTLELAAEEWLVSLDPSQFEQVILNLAVNSRDAMPRGGTFAIHSANCAIEGSTGDLALMPAGRYVRLCVSDTGIGMAEAVKARLFEPFFTTKERGKGTGLGLSMVYGAVKQSGGFIFVESELERGSTFSIYLPQAEGGQGAPAGAL